MIHVTTLVAVCLGVTVESQHIDLAFDPDAHTIEYTTRLEVQGPGPLFLALDERVEVTSLRLNGRDVEARVAPPEFGDARIEITLPDNARTLDLEARGRFEEDIAAGERPGQIHNFSVHAHVGPEGVFLSDGSAWHPRPLDADGRPALHAIRGDREAAVGEAGRHADGAGDRAPDGLVRIRLPRDPSAGLDLEPGVAVVLELRTDHHVERVVDDGPGVLDERADPIEVVGPRSQPEGRARVGTTR